MKETKRKTNKQKRKQKQTNQEKKKSPLTPVYLPADSVGGTSSGRSGVSPSPGSRVLLWRFLLDLLHNPRYSPIYIRWLDRPAGIFR